jgi:uncharacterized protein YeaO (DUF488 family)
MEKSRFLFADKIMSFQDDELIRTLVNKFQVSPSSEIRKQKQHNLEEFHLVQNKNNL